MNDTRGEHGSGGQAASPREAFDRWLQGFGGAWQNRDADALAGLFGDEASYFETPFGPPAKGRTAIREHWARSFAGQRNVVFMYRFMAMQGDLGVARWAAQFDLVEAERRIEFDGIVECRLSGTGRARVVRLWWHDREAPTRDGSSG